MSVRGGGQLQPGRLAGIGAASSSIDPMNKPDLSDSGLAKSGLANSDLVKQAISFVEDFTAFAGLNGVWAAALAVIARSVRRYRSSPPGATVVDRYRGGWRRRMDSQIH